MSIYNIEDKHHNIQHKSLSEWPEHLYMLGLQGMLVLRERRHYGL